MLTPESVAVTRGCEQWAVAGLEAEQVRISGPGSEHQSMVLTGRVIHAARAELGAELHTVQYGETERHMRPGGIYVVLLCIMPGAEAWQIVSWSETDSPDLEGVVDQAAVDVDARLQ